MAGDKRDFLHECLSDPALESVNKDGPEAFMEKACRVCRNVQCVRNPTEANNPWLERMRVQKAKLLDNPEFADVEDPRFDHLRNVDWKTDLRNAIAVEIATAKGDWSMPTPEDEMRYYAERAAESDVRPPKRLIDEVRVLDKQPDNAPPPVAPELELREWPCQRCGHVVKSVSMPRWCPNCDKAGGQESAPAAPPPEVEEESPVKIERAKTGRSACRHCREKIPIGSQRFGRFELDSMVGKAVWQWFHATCAEEQFPQDMSRARAQGAPPKPKPAAPTTRPPQPVSENSVPVSRTPPPKPSQAPTATSNTSVPSSGVLLPGAPPPNKPAPDPWSYPAAGAKPGVKKVPVGGTVRMGGDDPEGNS